MRYNRNKIKRITFLIAELLITSNHRNKFEIQDTELTIKCVKYNFEDKFSKVHTLKEIPTSPIVLRNLGPNGYLIGQSRLPTPYTRKTYNVEVRSSFLPVEIKRITIKNGIF